MVHVAAKFAFSPESGHGAALDKFSPKIAFCRHHGGSFCAGALSGQRAALLVSAQETHMRLIGAVPFKGK